jgi:hypothetical protein
VSALPDGKGPVVLLHLLLSPLLVFLLPW